MSSSIPDGVRPVAIVDGSQNWILRPSQATDTAYILATAVAAGSTTDVYTAPAGLPVAVRFVRVSLLWGAAAGYFHLVTNGAQGDLDVQVAAGQCVSFDWAFESGLGLEAGGVLAIFCSQAATVSVGVSYAIYGVA